MPDLGLAFGQGLKLVGQLGKLPFSCRLQTFLHLFEPAVFIDIDPEAEHDVAARLGNPYQLLESAGGCVAHGKNSNADHGVECVQGEIQGASQRIMPRNL